MLRRNNHVGYAEQSIRSGGINAKLLLFSLNGEIHLGALGTADPVFLGNLDAFDIIHAVQPVDQLVRIFRDL